jgi:UTP--glucose-1-phosphate uridylyltransferase
MTSSADLALEKLRADGADAMTLAAFRRRLEQLRDPAAGLLPGAELAPARDVPRLDELPTLDERERATTLDRLVVLKLNGGLGTSMGLRGPKSLIDVKPGRTFLDVVALQILDLRARQGVRLPLVLMDSFSTREPSLAALARHPRLAAAQDVPLDFVQGREPKLRADTLAPIDWPANRALEWCPPGHGDLYVSLHSSGMLAALRSADYEWAFVSNVDNLGAGVEPRIPAWAEAEGVPFVLEAARRTPADRKGGHLALRDGRYVLRESAQVPDGDESFDDIERWRHFNTNNLWIDLRALERLLAEQAGGPELPLIVNRKTVDPADPSSPVVLQLETAMGAAIGALDGARAVEVPRTRFAPVKTTGDLLVVRSDAYKLGGDGNLTPAYDGAERGEGPPVITLDTACYGRIGDLEARFPAGPPSLRRCRRLTVHGDVTFGADVVVEGAVELHGPARVPDGALLRG